MPFPITPRIVREAFDRTGLAPVQDVWIADGCACGLAAVAIDRAKRPVPDSVKAVCRLLGITEGQGLSFIAGFDGDPWTQGKPGASKVAYNVGRKSAQFVGLKV